MPLGCTLDELGERNPIARITQCHHWGIRLPTRCRVENSDRKRPESSREHLVLADSFECSRDRYDRDSGNELRIDKENDNAA